MKKIVSLLLALAMVLSCTAAAFAFSDVNDADTAAAAEVLRLMGVIDGYEDGTFRPNRGLSRAEFSKMAVYALGQQDAAAGYRTSTIFPDVKPSSWYAPYVNLCAKNAMIAGFPNGYFMPDSGLTVGQAAAIIIRAMEPGLDLTKFPSWPLSYMVEADRIGLLEGTGISPTEKDGNRAISRSEAARMFVAALKNGFGGYTKAEDTSIASLNASTSKVTMSGGTAYDMAKSFKTTSLVGSKGTLLTDKDGKFVTFIPDSNVGTGITNASLIVAKSGSTEGFSTLSENNSYRIYKNGFETSAADVKKGDVAIYSAANKTIILCDTRIHVYYEACEPDPKSPASITILGGQKFPVLDSAKDVIGQYKPGDEFTVMLTANGQIAGVTDLNPNNIAIVGADGTVSLICGTNLIKTNVTAPDKAGELVALSSVAASGKGSDRPYKISAIAYESTTYNYDPNTKIMDEIPLSANARIFFNGSQVSNADLGKDIIKADDISYISKDANGNIDILVIPVVNPHVYGKASFYTGPSDDESDDHVRQLTVEDSSGSKSYYTPDDFARNGQYYISGRLVTKVWDQRTGTSEQRLLNIKVLTEYRNVKTASFNGTKSVSYGGNLYTVSEDVQCYNKDSKSWMSLEQAIAYSDSCSIFTSDDNIVRIVEVGK